MEYFKFLCDKVDAGVQQLLEQKSTKLVERDTGGRKITIQCKEEGEDMFVTSIYAPVEHKEKQEWLNKLKVLKGRRVVGGDWNIATNKRDRFGDIRPKEVEEFQDQMEDYGMFNVTVTATGLQSERFELLLCAFSSVTSVNTNILSKNTVYLLLKLVRHLVLKCIY